MATGKHDKTGDGQGNYDARKTVDPNKVQGKPGKHEGGKDDGGKDDGGKKK